MKAPAVFCGNSNRALAAAIAHRLGDDLSDALVSSFSDGEVQVKLNVNVRGLDVFVVQALSPPINDHLMELLLIIDALKRASASRITCVLSYFGYARQDHLVMNATPVPAKLVSRLLERTGASRILTLDVTSPQVQGFFSMPVDNVTCLPVIADYISTYLSLNKPMVVGTMYIAGRANVSTGSQVLERARELATMLDCPVGMVEKLPDSKFALIGDVNGHDVIIFGDVIDTCRTMLSASRLLEESGASRLIAVGIHPIMSGGRSTIEQIEASAIELLIVTDSIPVDCDASSKIKVISVAPVLGECIRRIHNEEQMEGFPVPNVLAS